MAVRFTEEVPPCALQPAVPSDDGIPSDHAAVSAKANAVAKEPLELEAGSAPANVAALEPLDFEAGSAPAPKQLSQSPSFLQSLKSSVMATAQSQKAVDAIIKRVGAVPSSWRNRTTAIQEPEAYTHSSVIVREVTENPERFTAAEQKSARFMQRAWSTGIVSSRTAADAIYAPGANPYAADQLGIMMLRGFRMKSFALIIVQAICTLIVGIGVDKAVGRTHVGYYVLGGLTALLVVLLAVVAALRHRVPWNYILEAAFTLVAGTLLGCLSEPLIDAQEMCCDGLDRVEKPQLYAMGFYSFGLVILGISSILGSRRRVMKCTHLSFIAITLTMIAFIVSWRITQFCPGVWLALMMIIVALCIVWVGIECDRLATKLNPDEYMLPVILVWADLLVVTLVFTIAILAVLAASGSGGDIDGPSCSGCYCDCGHFWVYDWGNGKNSRNQNRTEQTAASQVLGAQQV
mmetsp:Transcript_67751/g.220550  ORF Transcript_67751/g.220550 Transcript_67751/m.220550 type:complete len:462 (+) Transcript_67751:86-1471(+)